MPSDKELTIKLVELENGNTRLVIWEENQVVEIFESDIKSILNHLLHLVWMRNFTTDRFRVRK